MKVSEEASRVLDTSPPTSLRCLRGGAPPKELGAHLSSLRALPEGARRELWLVLGPSLADPVEPPVEAGLEAFSKRYALERDALARVIKACRFLLRSAARNDTSKDDFALDLRALIGADATIEALLLGGFEDAKASVRREIVRGSLADHGKLLVDVDWRVDRMISSERSDLLGTDIVVLTFHYQEGNQKERISLQLLPETVLKLKTLCGRLLP